MRLEIKGIDELQGSSVEIKRPFSYDKLKKALESAFILKGFEPFIILEDLEGGATEIQVAFFEGGEPVSFKSWLWLGIKDGDTLLFM